MSNLVEESYKVPPLKRSDIRELAKFVRTTLDCQEPELDIIELLEDKLQIALPGFYLMAGDEDSFDPNEFAKTYVASKRIILRNDVYLGACDGEPFHRFTCAHELGHLLLHKEPALKRAQLRSQLKPYECSEWQADCFAGELLVCADMATDCSSPNDIAKKFNVSMKAAKYQYRILRKDGYVS